MNPLLVQRIALLVVFITLIMLLLLMGYLFWLQRQAVAELDRPREAERQRRAARRTGRFPLSYRPPRR